MLFVEAPGAHPNGDAVYQAEREGRACDRQDGRVGNRERLLRLVQEPRRGLGRRDEPAERVDRDVERDVFEAWFPCIPDAAEALP